VAAVAWRRREARSLAEVGQFRAGSIAIMSRLSINSMPGLLVGPADDAMNKLIPPLSLRLAAAAAAAAAVGAH